MNTAFEDAGGAGQCVSARPVLVRNPRERVEVPAVQARYPVWLYSGGA